MHSTANEERLLIEYLWCQFTHVKFSRRWVTKVNKLKIDTKLSNSKHSKLFVLGPLRFLDDPWWSFIASWQSQCPEYQWGKQLACCNESFKWYHFCLLLLASLPRLTMYLQIIFGRNGNDVHTKSIEPKFPPTKPGPSPEVERKQICLVEKSTWDPGILCGMFPYHEIWKGKGTQKASRLTHHLFTAILPFWLLKDPDIYCNTWFIFFNLVLLPCWPSASALAVSPSRLHCAQGTGQIVPVVLRYPAQALGAPIGDRSATKWDQLSRDQGSPWVTRNGKRLKQLLENIQTLLEVAEMSWRNIFNLESTKRLEVSTLSKRTPTYPWSRPQASPKPKWKEFLHKLLVGGLWYVQGVCWGSLRPYQHKPRVCCVQNTNSILPFETHSHRIFCLLHSTSETSSCWMQVAGQKSMKIICVLYRVHLGTIFNLLVQFSFEDESQFHMLSTPYAIYSTMFANLASKAFIVAVHMNWWIPKKMQKSWGNHIGQLSSKEEDDNKVGLLYISVHLLQKVFPRTACFNSECLEASSHISCGTSAFRCTCQCIHARFAECWTHGDLGMERIWPPSAWQIQHLWS